MQDNPYSVLCGVIKAGAEAAIPVGYRLGTVLSRDEDVIKRIETGGLEYRSHEGELMIASGLTLRQGDTILMLPYDNDQRMILLCKVVGL